MLYKHVKPEHFVQGLPVGDLNDENLSAEQHRLLLEAVSKGIYEMSRSFDKLDRAGSLQKRGEDVADKKDS